MKGNEAKAVKYITNVRGTLGFSHMALWIEHRELLQHIPIFI